MSISPNSTSFCYLCDDFSANEDSLEHVILSSFGSPLSSYGLLCKRHNNELGSTVDKELFSQLGHFSDMLGVNKRSKNKVLTAYTENNDEYITTSGLKGGYLIKLLVGDHAITISAQTENEVKKKARKQIRKHGKSEETIKSALETLENAEFKDEYPPERKVWLKNNITDDPKMQRFVLNPMMIQAFIKIALNYYFKNSGKPEHVGKMISTMKMEAKDMNPKPKLIRMVNDHSVSRVKQENDISHVLYIKGDSDKGFLVCFIELFSFFRILVFMNLTYQGEDVEYAWGYDLLKKEVFSPIVRIKSSKTDMLNMQFNSDSSELLTNKYEEIITVFNNLNQSE